MVLEVLLLLHERLLYVGDVLVHDLPEELVVLEVLHEGEEIILADVIIAVHIEQIECEMLQLF